MTTELPEGKALPIDLELDSLIEPEKVIAEFAPELKMASWILAMLANTSTSPDARRETSALSLMVAAILNECGIDTTIDDSSVGLIISRLRDLR